MIHFSFHFLSSVAVFVAEVAKDGMTHFQSDDIGTVSGLMFRLDIFSDTTENLFRFRSDFCRKKLPRSKLPI